MNDNQSIFDMQWLEQAIRENWDIPEIARKVLPAAMVNIAVGRDDQTKEPLHDPRIRIAAAQALVAMHRQAMASQTPTERHEQFRQESLEQQRSRLFDLAARLGVGDLAEDIEPNEPQRGAARVDPPSANGGSAE